MNENIIELKETNQYDELTKDGLVLVDFYSNTCVPCKQLLSHLEAIAPSYPNLKVIKVNLQDHEEIRDKFEIRSVPVVKLYKAGNLIFNHTSLLSKIQLDTLIKFNSK